MTDSPQAIWWVFVLGILGSILLLVAVVGSLIVAQRRYLKLHRAHARRILESQEEERSRVARELHDDALQRVALIGHECAAAGREVSSAMPDQGRALDAIQVELQDLGVCIRALAHRLHPALIDRVGLTGALQGLRDDYARVFGLNVELELPAPNVALPVSPENALVLYRIAQEALHNVVKHAGVTTAELRLTARPDGIEVSITDRGRGFEVEGQGRAEGLGLISMRERAALGEGRTRVNSRPGGGTVVTAWLPAGPAQPA